MIESFYYPALKASGIAWSPHIPKHWKTRPVKAHFSVRLGKMLQNAAESPLDKKVPYLKAVHVNWGHVEVKDLPEMWASPEEISQYGVRGGDLLICEGGEVGRAGIVHEPPDEAIIQNALHRVRAQASSNIKFLMYGIYAVEGAGWFSILCNKATIAHLTREKLTELKMPIPNKNEQDSIVIFLDRKTAQIDDLIEKKERMIELLKEERAAVINHAVTRGLGPKVDLQDSGAQWLGKIPKQWRCKRLKYLAHLTNEAVASGRTGLCVDLENIESWTGRLINNDLSVNLEEMKAFRCGDVLFNKLRPYLAKVFMATQDGACGGELLVLRPDREVASQFLFYRCVSDVFISAVNGSTYGTKMPRASWDFIGNLLIPYPERNEQEKIASFLDEKTAQIDGQIGRAERSIELLREYRTALISQAVTGKIDLREMANAGR